MNQSGKLLVPVLGILAALGVSAAGVALVMHMQEREKRVATEQELALVVGERDELKGRLTEVERVKAETDVQLSRVRADLSKVEADLATSQETQKELAASVENREQEIARLTKDLTALRDERGTLAAQVEELTRERETLQTRLTDLEAAKGDLETKVMELSDQPTVELEKVSVSGAAVPAAGTVQPAMAVSSAVTDGQVVVVNREYDFIVMNLGRTHGLAVGQEFSIVRGDEVLGHVKVEKIYDELSAAAILPNSKKDSIREGDQVKAL